MNYLNFKWKNGHFLKLLGLVIVVSEESKKKKITCFLTLYNLFLDCVGRFYEDPAFLNHLSQNIKQQLLETLTPAHWEDDV